MATCDVCFRHCRLEEGEVGFCGARENREGVIRPANYGIVTSAALDPVEKKPLARFYPGRDVFSIGSYGCNLHCPFCQNAAISMAKMGEDGTLRADLGKGERSIDYTVWSPEEVAERALFYKARGNIGLAYTYNEPLVGYEFVRDTAKEVRARGIKNILVTNGTATLDVLEEVLPYIDAMNIDLKTFQRAVYRELLGGELEAVKAFIERAARSSHVEITTLAVTDMNDSLFEIREIAAFIASLNGGKGREIPLHISRFFPAYHMTDRSATPPSRVLAMAKEARKYLKYVYLGNM
ncbi:MAG: radical SAM protein [Peptoniphilus sp.]|nr:radical SAM protein [Peptoniphilus sp.]MDD7363421.1 radical SAM protein [Bacillota bacterium]MDY6044423.1 radical SAM protein [Peptoniphilus sp.]